MKGGKQIVIMSEEQKLSTTTGKKANSNDDLLQKLWLTQPDNNEAQFDIPGTYFENSVSSVGKFNECKQSEPSNCLCQRQSSSQISRLSQKYSPNRTKNIAESFCKNIQQISLEADDMGKFTHLPKISQRVLSQQALKCDEKSEELQMNGFQLQKARIVSINLWKRQNGRPLTFQPQNPIEKVNELKDRFQYVVYICHTKPDLVKAEKSDHIDFFHDATDKNQAHNFQVNFYSEQLWRSKTEQTFTTKHTSSTFPNKKILHEKKQKKHIQFNQVRQKRDLSRNLIVYPKQSNPNKEAYRSYSVSQKTGGKKQWNCPQKYGTFKVSSHKISHSIWISQYQTPNRQKGRQFEENTKKDSYSSNSRHSKSLSKKRYSPISTYGLKNLQIPSITNTRFKSPHNKKIKIVRKSSKCK